LPCFLTNSIYWMGGNYSCFLKCKGYYLHTKVYISSQDHCKNCSDHCQRGLYCKNTVHQTPRAESWCKKFAKDIIWLCNLLCLIVGSIKIYCCLFFHLRASREFVRRIFWSHGYFLAPGRFRPLSITSIKKWCRNEHIFWGMIGGWLDW
jgi:hypothetical protein